MCYRTDLSQTHQRQPRPKPRDLLGLLVPEPIWWSSFLSAKQTKKILPTPDHRAKTHRVFRRQSTQHWPAPLAPAQTHHGPSGQQWPKAHDRVSMTRGVGARVPHQHTGASRNPHRSQDRAGAYMVLPSVQVSNVLFIHYF